MTALQSFADRWAALALTIAWQMALLAALVWVAERLFVRKALPRHLLWWFALAAPLVVVPVRAALTQAHALLAVPAPAPEVITRFPVALAVGPVVPPAIAPSVLTLPALPWWRTVRVIDGLLLLWAAGALLLALRLLRSHRRLSRLLAQSRPVESTALQQAFAVRCTEAGLRRPVALYASEDVRAPGLYGWRRPVVLLPHDLLEAFDAEQLHALLVHEVAHLRRHDFVANLLQRLLEALLFLHPAAWLASWRVTLSREELCDAWALSRGVPAAVYAKSLAAAAERAQLRPALVLVGLAEERSSLLRRVEKIMSGRGAGMVTRRVAVTLGAALILSAVAFAAVQLRTPARVPKPRPVVTSQPAPAPAPARPGEVVEVLPSSTSMTAQETEVALNQLGLQTQKLSYRLPFAHQVEVVIEHYERGKLVETIYSYSGSGDAGEHTLMLFIRRKDDDLTFSASLLDKHGWSSGSTGDVVSLKQYRGSFGSAGMTIDPLQVGVKTPFWSFRADRRTSGTFTDPGSARDVPKFASEHDLALVAYITLRRAGRTQATSAPQPADSEGELLASVRAGMQHHAASIRSFRGTVQVLQSTGPANAESRETIHVAFNGKRLHLSSRRTQGEPFRSEGAFDGTNTTEVVETAGGKRSVTIEPGLAGFTAGYFSLLVDPRQHGALPIPADATVRIAGRARLNGRDCIVVDLTVPLSAAGWPYTWAKAWVDPAQGFTVPKVIWWTAKSAAVEPTLLREETAEVKQYGPGLWGPARTTRIEYQPDGTEEKRVVVTYDSDFRLNVPITDEELALVLPPGTTITGTARRNS